LPRRLARTTCKWHEDHEHEDHEDNTQHWPSTKTTHSTGLALVLNPSALFALTTSEWHEDKKQHGVVISVHAPCARGQGPTTQHGLMAGVQKSASEQQRAAGAAATSCSQNTVTSCAAKTRSRHETLTNEHCRRCNVMPPQHHCRGQQTRSAPHRLEARGYTRPCIPPPFARLYCLRPFLLLLLLLHSPQPLSHLGHRGVQQLHLEYQRARARARTASAGWHANASTPLEKARKRHRASFQAP